VVIRQNPLIDSNDFRTYCWGEKYTSTKIYAHIHKHIEVPNVFKWIWRPSCDEDKGFCLGIIGGSFEYT
jgi:hypothetical protein